MVTTWYMLALLTGGFGDYTRLDYGTGKLILVSTGYSHRTSFCM